MSDRNLVSIILLAYKQEEFIRDAVRGVLAQTYEPLEVVLSDDSSPDRTYEFMVDEAKNYKGPHTIVLNRNKENMGLIRHLEKAVSLSKSEFLVVQAGDDISTPTRVEKLVDARNNNAQADLVCSDVFMIDEHGRTIQHGWSLSRLANALTLDQAISAGGCFVIGCTCGYSRRLFTEFSPISENIFQEDNVLPFRALLRNGICVLPDYLVGYRTHEHNIFLGKAKELTQERRKSFALNRLGIAREMLKAWDETGLEHDERYKKIKVEEMRRWYEVACNDARAPEILRLSFKGLFDGLTVRNSLGLLWRHIIKYRLLK